MAELDRFLGAADDGEANVCSFETIPVVAFTFEGVRYAVAADQTASIIPMRPVTRVPGAHAGLAGAIQDRGRVIALLSSPLGEAQVRATAGRVVVCRTARGLIGLPASALHEIQELHVQSHPVHGSVVENGGHAYTFLDANALLRVTTTESVERSS